MFMKKQETIKALFRVFCEVTRPPPLEDYNTTQLRFHADRLIPNRHVESIQRSSFPRITFSISEGSSVLLNGKLATFRWHLDSGDLDEFPGTSSTMLSIPGAPCAGDWHNLFVAIRKAIPAARRPIFDNSSNPTRTRRTWRSVAPSLAQVPCTRSFPIQMPPWSE